ncbi:MAG: hypothetical protein V2I48_15735 [Xanthomonadales bacterium]|jgi:hypothetical protein|nr:hypothetical protein [Xanthomonadales bacterium]
MNSNPTPAERLQSAADGIKHVATTLEQDPVRACELLAALAGNLQWIAEQIEGTR